MNFLKNLFGGAGNTALKNIIRDGAFLADVRTPEEFAAGHVPGSVNIPLEKLPMQLTLFRNKKNIVVFCRSGNRSSMAKTWLEKNGISNVFNGGTWQAVAKLIQ